MTQPLQDLVAVNDPDWQSYQSKDPDWYLRVAGQAIRKFCGWHIFPNISVTVSQLASGTHGIIMLPSLYVTAVDSLAVATGTNTAVVVDPSDYDWFPAGWIQRKGWSYYSNWFYAGYYYGNDPYYLPVNAPGLATVTFSHGYDTVPTDIKEVAFELAQATMDNNAGNVKEIASPGYRFMPSQNFGLSLNPEQRDRLAKYRINWTA